MVEHAPSEATETTRRPETQLKILATTPLGQLIMNGMVNALDVIEAGFALEDAGELPDADTVFDKCIWEILPLLKEAA